MRSRRLSLGHLIMIVSGLLAFLLTMSLVRGRNEVLRVAVAGRKDCRGGLGVDPQTALAAAVTIGQGEGHVGLARSAGADRQPRAPVPTPPPTPTPTESSQGG